MHTSYYMYHKMLHQYHTEYTPEDRRNNTKKNETKYEEAHN